MLKKQYIVLSLSLIACFSATASPEEESSKPPFASKVTDVSLKKKNSVVDVQSTNAPALITSTNAERPDEFTIGIYLFNVRDVNTGKGTFTSDFCIWSQSTNTGNIISELQFANAERVVWSVEGAPQVPGISCIKRCGTGTFRMKWGLHDYPNDSQNLKIAIDYTLEDSSKIILKPDLLNSGISKENLPQGWSFKSFKIEPVSLVLSSNLGDSTLGNARAAFPGLEVSLEISRNESIEYWSMTIIAYATVIMMFLSYFIDVTNTSRLGILGAAFIACIISLRTSMGTINNFDNRVAWLHFIVIGFITFSVIITAVLAYLLHHKADPHKLRGYSMAMGIVMLGSFILTNYFLLRH
jgi:hypothetical protein